MLRDLFYDLVSDIMYLCQQKKQKNFKVQNSKKDSRKWTKFFNLSHYQVSAGESTKMDLVADFHRLNVVLMKRVKENKVFVGQKVATVTISDAHVQASTGTVWNENVEL